MALAHRHHIMLLGVDQLQRAAQGDHRNCSHDTHRSGIVTTSIPGVILNKCNSSGSIKGNMNESQYNQEKHTNWKNHKNKKGQWY